MLGDSLRRHYGTLIYAIQGEAGGPVKIGVATDIEARFRTIQSCSPVPLVVRAVQLGGYQEEEELHFRFRSSRLHGEWFEPSKEMERVFGVGLT
jgi:hypothetical protein